MADPFFTDVDTFWKEITDITSLTAFLDSLGDEYFTQFQATEDLESEYLKALLKTSILKKYYIAIVLKSTANYDLLSLSPGYAILNGNSLVNYTENYLWIRSQHRSSMEKRRDGT
ncbi:hypothetical protein Tco_0548427 [Tanacetum coccineum]